MAEALQSGILESAIEAGTLIAVVAAVVGYFLVLRGYAFAAEALTDIGFAGATGAALLGMGSLFGMLVFSLVSAFGLGALGRRIRGRDIEVGMVLSLALGVGVLFLSLYAHSSAQHTSAGVAILFGSILTVRHSVVVVALALGIAAVVAIGTVFRPLLFASIDPDVAASRGIRVQGLNTLFLLVLAVTTSVSILVVGVLLVAALLVAPAAAAVNVARRPAAAVAVAIAIGVGATWAGTLLAFVGTGRHLPISFYIAAISAAAYFSSLLARRRRRARPAAHHHAHPNREVGRAV